MYRSSFSDLTGFAEANPAALPRATIAWAILREASSIISSPSMTAPRASTMVAWA